MNDPVIVPADNNNTHVFGHVSLIAASGDHWGNGQYHNALINQRGNRNDIHPAYFTQSLIERIIVRLYEFKALMEQDLPNANTMAINRYKNYLDTQPSNQQRFATLLGGEASVKQFLAFLENHPSFNSTFGEQADLVRAMFQSLSQSNELPKMPVIYQGKITDYNPAMNPDKVTISYDTQNVVEQILFMARTLGPEFVNRNNINATKWF